MVSREYIDHHHEGHAGSVSNGLMENWSKTTIA